jgi:hypothetical protein
MNIPLFKMQSVEYLRSNGCEEIEVLKPPLSNGYRGSFPEKKNAWSMTTTHHHLFPRLRTSGVMPLLPFWAFISCAVQIYPSFTTTTELGSSEKLLYAK